MFLIIGDTKNLLTAPEHFKKLWTKRCVLKSVKQKSSLTIKTLSVSTQFPNSSFSLKNTHNKNHPALSLIITITPSITKWNNSYHFCSTPYIQWKLSPLNILAQGKKRLMIKTWRKCKITVKPRLTFNRPLTCNMKSL